MQHASPRFKDTTTLLYLSRFIHLLHILRLAAMKVLLICGASDGIFIYNFERIQRDYEISYHTMAISYHNIIDYNSFIWFNKFN